VDRLFERNDRNAEPRSIDEEALDRIQLLGHAPRGGAWIVRPRKLAPLPHLQPEHPVLVHGRSAVQVTRHHPQLPELLLRRHPAE
jgi:hypothetical protein